MSDSQTTAPPTAKVRLRVLITHEGKWAAYGHNDDPGRDDNDVCGDMLSGEDCDWAKSYILEAEIPIPQQRVVVAGVIAAQVTEDEAT